MVETQDNFEVGGKHESSSVFGGKTKKFLKVAIPILPLFILGYFLYINYLPLGYSRSLFIKVGSAKDTSGEFYLDSSKSLSARMTDKSGTYREINGLAYATFKPSDLLRDVKVDVSVDGENITIDQPVLDINPERFTWEISWKFDNEIPTELKGNAFFFDSYAAFDGKSSLELPESQDMYESGPFYVYAKWMPKNNQKDFQELVGHYNWEIIQDSDKIRFMVGRMNDQDGPFYTVTYPIDKDFFNKQHELVASYLPGDNGHIEIAIDDKIFRQSIGKDTIWTGYNKFRPLSFGKAGHDGAEYFEGNLYQVSMTQNKIDLMRLSSNVKNETKSFDYEPGKEELKIPLFGYGKLREVNIKIRKEKWKLSKYFQ